MCSWTTYPIGCEYLNYGSCTEFSCGHFINPYCPWLVIIGILLFFIVSLLSIRYFSNKKLRQTVIKRGKEDE